MVEKRVNRNERYRKNHRVSTTTVLGVLCALLLAIAMIQTYRVYSLTTSNDHLKARIVTYKAIEEKYNTLQDDYSNLEQENATLEKENEELKTTADTSDYTTSDGYTSDYGDTSDGSDTTTDGSSWLDWWNDLFSNEYASEY